MKKLLFIIPFILLLFTVFTASSYSEESAGRVLTVKRNVYVIRNDERTDAEPQMILYQNDAVETDKKSRAKIFFNDDSILNLGELSRVEVNEYLYDNEKERSKSIYKLMEGSLRVVVGRSDLEIHTPTAVVAARGTMIVVRVEIDAAGVITSHFLMFDGTATLRSVLAGVDDFVTLQTGEMGSVSSGEGAGIVQPIDPALAAEYDNFTDVLAPYLEDTYEDIPEQVLDTVFENLPLVGGDDDDDDDDPPPPPVTGDDDDDDTGPPDNPPPPPPIIDYQPNTPVTLDVVFPD